MAQCGGLHLRRYRLNYQLQANVLSHRPYVAITEIYNAFFSRSELAETMCIDTMLHVASNHRYRLEYHPAFLMPAFATDNPVHPFLTRDPNMNHLLLWANKKTTCQFLTSSQVKGIDTLYEVDDGHAG